MRWVYIAGILTIVSTLVADIWVDINYRVAANVSLIYIAILATSFAALYGGGSKWWTNRIGRIFLIQTVLLACVLIQACVAVWVSAEYPDRHIFRFIIYSLGAVAYLPMLFSLRREQKRDRRLRRSEASGEVTPPADSS